MFLALAPEAPGAEPATARRAMVATVHPLATRAGLAAIEQGGNAVDAAVAAALMLGVVDGHNSGIGGGCLVLLRLADGRLIAIDGRETAPAKASPDMYIHEGRLHPEWSKVGPLASGVPGALAAYELAIEKFGRRKLRNLLLPAADVAERGFGIDRVLAARLQSTAKTLWRFEGSRILLKPDGSPLKEGDVLLQPDLARTYRAVAEHGLDWFYRGPFAASVGAWMADNGGILAASDFASYEAKFREPVVSDFRGYTVVGFPPPSSGGTHVAQILNIVERFDLRALEESDPAAAVHVVAEAMKLAFADRAHWLGDSDFARVPRGLVDKRYATRLAERIDLEKAAAVPGPGRPPRAESDLFGKHTTHIAAADAEGNWVAITATVNTSFGSKVIVPGTGVVLNNQMDDFSLHPGVPNAFGLVGSEANEIRPGKRPLSSMSPTIVLKGGQPIMTVGAAGGPRIISQVVLAMLNHLERGLPIDQALAAPRFHHQWLPDRLYVESGFDEALVKELESRGHTVETGSHAGVTQAIVLAGDGRSLVGMHDPRVPGLAAGLPRPRRPLAPPTEPQVRPLQSGVGMVAPSAGRGIPPRGKFRLGRPRCKLRR